jgi:hypothetical protein
MLLTMSIQYIIMTMGMDTVMKADTIMDTEICHSTDNKSTEMNLPNFSRVIDGKDITGCLNKQLFIGGLSGIEERVAFPSNLFSLCTQKNA